MSSIKVFVITLKESDRIKKIKKRLKDLKINFEIFYGINGHKKKNISKLLKSYNSQKTENYIGRKLALPEIAASLSHINIYKIIVRRKIKSAIIIEDDAYPSKILSSWIKKKNKIEDNLILSFYSYPSGFLSKRGKETKLKDVKIHNALTHINNSSCYQINFNTCKKILKITKGKICGVGDWPFSIHKDNIKLATTLPYLTVIDDYYKSFTALARQKYLSKNIFLEKLNNFLFFKILKNIYYISYFPLFIKKMHFQFYKEMFVEKSLFFFKDIFFRNYISTYKIFNNKKYYCKDLIFHRFFQKHV